MNTSLYRPKKLAEALSVSERTVRQWQADRVLPYIKIGRTILFDFNKVMAALDKFERKAPAR
jgi:excisionase family DNA binding protein